VAENYAKILDELRRKGHPIPVNALWISACCLCVNGLLLTVGRHFSAVDGLNAHLLTN
jgi:predicted nucleic acid-binding protein